MEDDCKKVSSTSNIPLPENFSLSDSFVKTMAKNGFSVPFLKAAMLLKKNGKTSVVQGSGIMTAIFISLDLLSNQFSTF